MSAHPPPSSPRYRRLGPSTATRVFDGVEQALEDLLARFEGGMMSGRDSPGPPAGGRTAPAAHGPPEPTPDQIQEAFQRILESFQAQLAPVRDQLRGATTVLYVVIAATILAAILAAFLAPGHPWVGGLLSTAGIALIANQIRKMLDWGRDLAMLHLIPVETYVSYLLCTSINCRKKVIQDFLDGMRRLREGR